MLDKYKVNIQNETKELVDKIEREKVYTDFINSQEQGFIRFIEYINYVVDTLKKKALISPFIEIRARIKDVNSAIKNHIEDRLLDDVFGIEIICANENEKNIIKEELEKCLKSTRTKKHNKPNGYKAEHESYSVKNDIYDTNINKWNLTDLNVPAVECQFKTIEVELNPEASHHDYKKADKYEIQQLLNKKILEIGKEIPRMWVSRENGIYELGYKEIIQRIYPFIDITKIKENEERIK